jgi:Rod binding domain-containing protein
MTSALPPIDQATLPAEVRNGTKQDKKAYEAALGFERMLLGELTKAMAETAKPIDGGDGEGAADGSGQSQDVASSLYMQMLPDQLADAVTSAGGLGLAQSLYQTIKERS